MPLELRGLRKSWKDFSLEVDLSLADGETLVLAGMSGCGKTTVLNMISGLVSPDGGDLILDGRRINDVPPWKRGISFVFQEPALFPHLDTGRNVGYGLFLRGVPRARRRLRVREQLEALRLGGYEKRKPGSLSGGERQRAAIARALAASPRLLLLDEPFSSLDAPLREALRGEFRELLRAAPFPCVFVTHDREEAAVLADRIAFIREGRVAEEGTARDVFLAPRTRAGAEFFGAGTVLPCSLLVPHDAVSLAPGAGKVPLAARLSSALFEGNRTALEFEVPLPGRSGAAALRSWQSPRAPCPPEGSAVTVWITPGLLRLVEDR